MVNTKGGRQGGSFRRGFSRAEMAAFATGKQVLWKDNRRWNTGVVVKGPTADVTGAMYVTIRNTDKPTRNVGAGETTRAYPGSVKPK